MVFWHPKGWTIWQQVEQLMRRILNDKAVTRKYVPRQ